LVDFILATGLRIGEVLAVTWDALDLDTGTVEVRGTVVRKPGRGGLHIQLKPKSEAGWRTLHLPDWLVVLLHARKRVETVREVARPAGHSPVSLAQDVYVGRRSGSPRAAVSWEVARPKGFEPLTPASPSAQALQFLASWG
jgi:integrase